MIDNLEDNLTYKVVKDNYLIQNTQTDLTRNEQKLVNYLVSMIKPSDEDFKPYRISVTEFAKLVGIDKTHASRDFDYIAKSIEKKTFWFENNGVITKIYWIQNSRYLDRKRIVEYRLNPAIKKYLLGLKKNYTQYDLYNVLGLKFKYSIRLYELLKSYAYKGTIDFNVDELKKLLSAETTSYKSFGLFRQKVLDAALDDINDNTDLDISYKCLDSYKKEMTSLQGRKVFYLRFSIKAKDVQTTSQILQRAKDRINGVVSKSYLTQSLEREQQNDLSEVLKQSEIIKKTNEPLQFTVTVNGLNINAAIKPNVEVAKPRSFFSRILDVIKRK